MCYVGKATKIFFFLVAAAAVAGLILGLGLLRHSWARKDAHPCQSNVACHPIFPDPIPANTAAAPIPTTTTNPTVATTPTTTTNPTAAATPTTTTNPTAAATPTTPTPSTAFPPLQSPPSPISATLGPVHS